MDYLLAIDAGTGSVRAVLFDTNGIQIGCVQKEWFHREDPRYPGSMDFDCKANWELAASCVREVIAAPGINLSRILAVSTTCMREGFVLYDSAGNELWACANVDARAGDEVAELKRISVSLEQELYAETGQTFALGALPRLLWVKNKQPEIYRKTAKIGMINDWLIYKLSGVFTSEPSNGSTTGLFSLKTRRWDAAIAARCGLHTGIFPDTAECGERAGAVSAKGAKDTGLIEGTPVVTGGGDCQLGTVGVGVVNDNEAAVFGGSFWQYEYNTASEALPAECSLRVNCHALPSLRQYEALAFNPGLAVRWYRDAFCMEEKRVALRLNTAEKPVDAYALLDGAASTIPAGCGGMLCAFSDVMNYISWRHAAPTFTNFALDAAAFNKYTFYRALLENACLVTRGHLELVSKTTGSVPRSVTFAGGAAKSKLWAQILADVLELPVNVPVVKEASALGAAIFAGKGAGLYASIEETAKEFVKIERTFMPEPQNTGAYRKAFAAWKAVYPAQLELADKKLTSYMWRAPGL
ncbi:MAG: autoinducer-2 kinase [Spirochaetaceae bacterium]|jgi:autoinducer 2 (AI-2) kinase|nr:autoinducer-2 kinase [Spirochaetaceae bacterium]